MRTQSSFLVFDPFLELLYVVVGRPYAVGAVRLDRTLDVDDVLLRMLNLKLGLSVHQVAVDQYPHVPEILDQFHNIQVLVYLLLGFVVQLQQLLELGRLEVVEPILLEGLASSHEVKPHRFLQVNLNTFVLFYLCLLGV